MASALGQLLPIAVANAVSSVPIMVTILMLLSPRRGKTAIPFLVAWVAGMAGVIVLVLLGVGALPLKPFRLLQTSIAIAEVVLGVALIGAAALAWPRASRSEADSRNPWLDRVDRLGPVSAAGLGLVLNLRPKSLLLATAAGLAITSATDRGSDTAVAVTFYVVLSTSTVTVPIIATLASPTRMEPRLRHAADWLDRNGGYVTAVVLLLVGVVLGAGLIRL